MRTKNERISAGFHRVGVILGMLTALPGVVLISTALHSYWSMRGSLFADIPPHPSEQALFGALWIAGGLALYGAARTVGWIVNGFFGD